MHPKPTGKSLLEHSNAGKLLHEMARNSEQQKRTLPCNNASGPRARRHAELRTYPRQLEHLCGRPMPYSDTMACAPPGEPYMPRAQFMSDDRIEPSQRPTPSDQDVYLFREGTLSNVHHMLGCHLLQDGAAFAVWAPNASAVSVIGDWNGWDAGANSLEPRTDGSGIWEGVLPDVKQGHAYKYRIVSRSGDRVLEKADPVGSYCELPPATASRVWALDYDWQDAEWMAIARRAQRPGCAHGDLRSCTGLVAPQGRRVSRVIASWRMRWPTT